MHSYLALLRGINVGGKNIIPMTKLKACFESLGFDNVRTYIQSGNVLFSDKQSDVEKLTKKIESCLSKTFDFEARIVVVSEKQLKEVVKKAPKGFGKQPEKYRYDVIFLKAPHTAKDVFKDFPLKEGVDQGWAGKHVIYTSRLIVKATQSRISKITQMPAYKFMTIRNWNTTTKLLSMMVP